MEKFLKYFISLLFYNIANIVPKSNMKYIKIKITPYFTAKGYKQTHIMNRVLLYDMY